MLVPMLWWYQLLYPPCKEVMQGSGVTVPSCMEAIKQLVCKAGFCEEVVKVFVTKVRKSTTHSCQGKWSRFLHWCCGRNIGPCKATVHQVGQFFLHVCKELRFSMPLVKGYRAAKNHVFALSRTDLAANRVVDSVFSSFERNCLPR